MLLKPVLVAVALSLAVTATPVDTQAGGTVIPLHKRASITNEDGTFNYELALKSMQRTHNKHRQNLMNLERNSGRQAFAHVSGRTRNLSSRTQLRYLGRRNQALVQCLAFPSSHADGQRLSSHALQCISDWRVRT